MHRDGEWPWPVLWVSSTFRRSVERLGVRAGSSAYRAVSATIGALGSARTVEPTGRARPSPRIDDAEADGMLGAMAAYALKARVENGKVIVDETADLPDGEIYLLPVSPDALMDDSERSALDEELEKAMADEEAGRLVDSKSLMDRLD